uniref:Nucleoside-diphosphate kinase n=1 Tax=Gopherus evgoodei TaxID=1825980 RepID=A0A8C4YLC5_9SAUR
PFNACSQLLPTLTSVKFNSFLMIYTSVGERKTRPLFSMSLLAKAWGCSGTDASLTLSCFSGGPGSGKGTQSTKMASHFGFVCISVGEILRNQLTHHATSNRKWELIAKIIANGELAPPVSPGQSFLSPLQRSLRGHPSMPQETPAFCTQGPPSSHQLGMTFWSLLSWAGFSPAVYLVVFLACSNQRLRQHLEKRAQEQGRPDDNAHAIDRRVETFKQNIPLIVKYYQEKSIIFRFDADREEDDIFGDISSMVQERLFPHGIDAAGESRAPSAQSG